MTKGFAKRFAPIAALAFSTALSACSLDMDWGEVEGVPLAEFDTSGEAPSELYIAGPDQLIVTEGETLTITVEGDAEAGEALRFDRDGDRLTIARDSNIFDGSGKAIVRISMPPASTLGVAGSGSIEAASIGSDASIEIAGSGDISIDTITAQRLEVEIAGSGNVRGAGTANELTVEIAGSGNVRLAELMAETVKVEIAGSGDVELSSDGTVDAEMAGAGNVRVTGNAKCSLESAGSGNLTCRPAEASADNAATEEASAD